MEKFQACLHNVIITLFLTAGFSIVVITGSCSNAKFSASSRFVIGENMADGYALIGHVFQNVSVVGVLNCYQTCQPNCRCISFNFLTNVNQDNCQLNEENRRLKPCALMPVEGSQYYDVVTGYSVKTASSSSPCTQCINRCCSDQPCLNGGTCRENCEATGKRFICDCPAGFTGQLCEKSCSQLVQEALGMKTGVISGAQITASTEYSSTYAARKGRLHGSAAWSANTNDVNQWLQIDLGRDYPTVTRVATQGSSANSEWVTKYKLVYSNDGVNFAPYRVQGQAKLKEFAGNTDQDTVVSHDLNPPIKARYIQFRPLTWNDWISMRVELFGVQGCQSVKEDLGMESGAISDAQITASSEYNSDYAASNGRLQGSRAWTAADDDANQWLQIDLGANNPIVKRVATQGQGYYYNEFATSYKLEYSDDGVNFQYYRVQGQTQDKEFVGNEDQHSVVSHDLNPPITARYIRFRPETWKSHISMRVELYGCPGI